MRIYTPIKATITPTRASIIYFSSRPKPKNGNPMKTASKANIITSIPIVIRIPPIVLLDI
jgi:hypothetical protein